MAEENKKIEWAQVFIGALLTALLSIGVGIAIFHYTSKEPELAYTTFPISGFKTAQQSITIYNVQIENIGDKEAEDVQVSFTFPKSADVKDYNMDLSDKTINYSISDSNDMHNSIFKFPLLNPTENCKFSFLAENAEAGNIKVYLRGRGVIGEMRSTIKKGTSKLDYAIIIFISLMSFIFIFSFFTGASIRVAGLEIKRSGKHKIEIL